MEIREAKTKKDYAYCIYVRTLVFIVGQECPLHEEIDDTEEGVTDYIGLIDQNPVATARCRVINGVTAKIERVAVMNNRQGEGLGAKIMSHIIDELKSNSDIKEIKLGAQSHALKFYEGLGFDVCSDEYMDAGILHHDMEMKV